MKPHLPAALLLLTLATAAPAALVNHYTFENPVPGNAAFESDLGTDNTPIQLFNNALRAPGGAFPASSSSLRSRPLPSPPNNNDHKAGISLPANSTLLGTANATGITLMAWFKLSAMPTGTTSLFGLLRGHAGADPTLHDGRALMEIGTSGNALKVIALGRRRDTETSRPVTTSTADLPDILPLDQWVHLAAAFDFDLGAIKLYRNGIPLPASTPSFSTWGLTAGVDRVSNSASDGIKIGGQIDDDTTPFDGHIDEVRIYNEFLPATGPNSIAALYAAQIAPVPEPASLSLLAAAATALFVRRPRQTRG